MPFEIEVVVDVGMDANEFLSALHLPQPEHRSFASSEGEMAVLVLVVGPASDLLLSGVAELGPILQTDVVEAGPRSGLASSSSPQAMRASQ